MIDIDEGKEHLSWLHHPANAYREVK
jgi:hypothetical protein